MRLRLIREPSMECATLGALYVDGVWNCWTLEDVIREVKGSPVEQWKVYGKTAIPAGRYRVRFTFSQRFGRVLPLLEDVPGFTGIRIHPGNTVEDTEGCILPGSSRQPSRVFGSRVAFERLFEQISGAAECWIDVENPK